MERRRFTREFKVEAVKLVRERGVALRQAARDLNVHEYVLRKWCCHDEDPRRRGRCPVCAAAGRRGGAIASLRPCHQL